MKIWMEKALRLAAFLAVSLPLMSFVVGQNPAASTSEKDLEKWFAATAVTGLAGWFAGRKLLAADDHRKDRDNKKLGCCGIIAVITAVVVALVVLKQNDVF